MRGRPWCRWAVVVCLCAFAPARANTLVERARQEGRLDAETALLYQVLAVQAPEQLPSPYRGGADLPVCGTPAVAAAHHAWNRLGPVTRERLAKVLARPFLSESRLTPSGRLRVHFDRAGRDAVDAADQDVNGVPDYVDTVAAVFDRVWRLEVEELGYQAPPSDQVIGGGPEYDVYVVELGSGGAYGFTYPEQEGLTSYSYIEIDNNYTDFIYKETRGLEALRVTAAHEFFHAIHFGYYEAPDVSWWREASATWMEDVAYPEADDYLQYLDSFLLYPERSLDSGGGYSSDYHVYGASLFVHFLDQRFERRLVRLIWEELGHRLSASMENIDRVLRRDAESSLDAAMGEFAVWNYFTGSRFRPGYYAEGAKYPELRPHDVDVAAGTVVQDSGEVDHLASAYVRMLPRLRTGGVVVETALAHGWWSQHLARVSRDSAQALPLTDVNRATVAGWDQYDEVVLVLACTEQTGMGYGYRVSAEYDPALISEPSPVAFRLGPAYPNPFEPETWPRVLLPFDLSAPSLATRLAVYTSDGRLVRAYELGALSPRAYRRYSWDGRDGQGQPVASGIYYYVLDADGQRAARPLGLIRR